MNKKTILVVEDKDQFRKIYGDRLRFGGYDVLDAADGNIALTVLASHHVDLIITDINMPNKDGYQLIEELRAHEKFRHVPILVMTVFDEVEHYQKAIALGANDYLVKGMHTPNAVLEKVHKVISENQ